jgi:hypothetical protein
MTEMDRREFASSLILAALAPLLGGGREPAAWWDGLARAAVEEAAGDLDALASALAEVVRTQYGSRLNESDLATITRQIRTALERADAMRKVDLANGDEPDFVFAAGRGPVA